MARLPPPAADGTSEAASSSAPWMQSGVSGVARGCCAVSVWRSLTAEHDRSARSQMSLPHQRQRLCSLPCQGLDPGNKSEAGHSGNDAVIARQVMMPTSLGCSGRHTVASTGTDA